MAAPDFTEVDEQKAFLGVHSAEEAKRVFTLSYNDPRFFGSMTEMPFEEFKQQVLSTKEAPRLLDGALVGGESAHPLQKSSNRRYLHSYW